MNMGLTTDDRPPTLGVDLGGTKVETSLVSADGQIMASHRRLTHPEQGPDNVIADIVACVKGCLSEAGKAAQGLGIGVAGQVDGSTGSIRFAPNLGWRDVALGAKLQTSLEMPVVVSNDVRAATYGEWRYGAGQGVDDLICVFASTGVGGGIISGGRLLEGCNNTAGELGHITIVSGGRNCRCPNEGCLEAYVGGWAIAERAQEAASTDHRVARRLIALAGTPERISAATVAQAYNEKDALARRLVQETAQYLTAGLVGIVNAFNPCLLILGGGVIQGLPDLVPMVEINVRAGALPAAVQGLRIATSALGDKAGVIGAAAMARDQIPGRV
ncbi:ROK family protein [Chloroflexota bacterium]